MTVYVDATTLYELGMVGEVHLLGVFDEPVVIPQSVIDEVPTEPAATNVTRFLDDETQHETPISTTVDAEGFREDAANLLASDAPGDVDLIAGILASLDAGEPTGLVSGDTRLRAIAKGLGATVTGTFGVVARAAREDKYFPASQAKRVLRRVDRHGLHMTGELRHRAIGDVRDE
jgi:predicted nucleic acid-binding protein